MKSRLQLRVLLTAGLGLASLGADSSIGPLTPAVRTFSDLRRSCEGQGMDAMLKTKRDLLNRQPRYTVTCVPRPQPIEGVELNAQQLDALDTCFNAGQDAEVEIKNDGTTEVRCRPVKE